MQAFQIEIGSDYGFRDNPLRTDPLQRVRVLEKVRRKWKVEWVDPDPGLVDYVRSAQLVVNWQDRKEMLRDEANWAALGRACDQSWPGHSHPLSEAVDLIFDSTGEVAWVDNSGVLCAPPDALERIGHRASRDVELVRPAFLDRDGTARLPFDVAIDVAQAFAAAEPQTVLREVETVERKYERESRELGNEYLVPTVNRLRACWALCRQWAGFDEAIAQREREIERLLRIVEDVKYDLRRSGQDELARKLDQRLKG